MASAKAYAHAIKELDPLSIEQAMKHPDSVYVGVMEAYTKKRWRDLSSLRDVGTNG